MGSESQQFLCIYCLLSTPYILDVVAEDAGLRQQMFSTLMLQQVEGALVVQEQQAAQSGHHPPVPMGLWDVHGPGGGALGAAGPGARAQSLGVQGLGVCQERLGG